MRAARLTALGAGAAALLLLVAAPRPAAALALIREPALAADPTDPVVALLSLLAWLLAGWLALGVALTAGSRLPGRAGRALAATARRTVPYALRRTAEVALGMTVAVGSLGTPATAATPDGGAAAAAAPVTPSLDWGVPPPAATPVATEAPATPPAAEPATALALAGPEPHQVVVVRPGDTLWALAAEELTARAGTSPQDAEVAQRWPAWWAANRDAVGADPHHITPGLHLSAPPA